MGGWWRVGGGLETRIRSPPRQEGSCLPLRRGERPQDIRHPLARCRCEGSRGGLPGSRRRLLGTQTRRKAPGSSRVACASIPSPPPPLHAVLRVLGLLKQPCPVRRRSEERVRQALTASAAVPALGRCSLCRLPCSHTGQGPPLRAVTSETKP